MNTRDIIQDKIKEIPKSPFGDHEESVIISLMLDHPEFFTTLTRYINPNTFMRDDAKYVVAIIMDYHEKYSIYPTRGMVLDTAMRELTVDHIDSDEIIELINRKSNPREIPSIKDRLLDYAKCRAWEKVFHPTTSDRWRKGDLDYVNEVINEANNVRDISRAGLWFFDDIEKLYHNDEQDRFTTGIASLDRMFGDGGPARKEMMVILAPTGRGKCHTLQSKIIEERLSRIYELETEDGKISRLAGFREVQTARGTVKVCNLTETDSIIEIFNVSDAGDIYLPDMRI